MSLQYIIDRIHEYGEKAVKADREGDYEKALKYYKIAIEFMIKYLRLYPDGSMTEFYKSLLHKYKARIKILEKHIQKVSASGPGESSSDIKILYPNQGRRKNYTFKDIVDLEHVKKALKRAIIYPIKTPELYPLGWAQGVLLFGPPGCGKTLIAYALANEVNAVIIEVTPATIMSKWLGEAEKNVRKVFKTAREIASKGTPVIIFMDEVDGLLQQYSDEVGGERRVRNQFLMEMDGLESKMNNKLPLFVIGATNKPWNLDIGFIRRFEKRIYVPPPNKKVRKKLFEYYIKQLCNSPRYEIDENLDLDKLAELSEGYSSADIFNIVREVQENIAEEINEKGISKGEKRIITLEDFIKVIKNRKPSIDKKMIMNYEIWNKKHGTN